MNASVLVIHKPAGPTSFDVVRSVKRILPKAKIGHGGSLDPFATGVLVLLLGRATKLSTALLNADKSYVGKVNLGTATDTMDGTGTVIKRLEVPELTDKNVVETLKSFEGTWQQTPPMYSAKKFHGVRLYELARQNILIQRSTIPVQIYDLSLLKWESSLIEFRVHCSKGTYVRSLADEIGTRLGTVGHLSELCRESCGDFTLDDAITLEQLEANPEKALEKGLQHYLALLRNEQIVRRTREGAQFEVRPHG